MPVLVLLAAGEDHLLALQLGALADQDRREVTLVAVAIAHDQLSHSLDVCLDLRDQAAVGRAGDGGHQGGEACVTAEHLADHDALVRGGRRLDLVRQRDGAGDAGGEAHAVVGAGHVVVHRLGDGHYLGAAPVQFYRVTECVVAAHRDEVVDAEEVEVGDHLVGEVVLLGRVLVLEVRRYVLGRDGARARARGEQHGAAGLADRLDLGGGQREPPLGVVGAGVADDLDKALPAALDAEDVEALVDRAQGDRADGRIESGDVATAGEHGDASPCSLDLRHVPLLPPPMTGSAPPPPGPRTERPRTRAKPGAHLSQSGRRVRLDPTACVRDLG